MTNMEFYRDKIEQINDNNTMIALVEDEPVECRGLNCTRCNFRDGVRSCSVNCTRWLMEEHVEKPKLSQAEMTFLKASNIECWIARDADGALCLYPSEPSISWDEWAADDDRIVHIVPKFFPHVHFDFITWESQKAWSVKELLESEVK